MHNEYNIQAVLLYREQFTVAEVAAIYVNWADSQPKKVRHSMFEAFMAAFPADKATLFEQMVYYFRPAWK